MYELTRESPAKINLTLRVVGRRPDGYHELESLVARITLSDTVRVGRRTDRRLTVECSDPGIPCDQRNLALRAARMLAEAVGVDDGVHVSIDKRIPAGAGLGGGSSNAAATLLLLNELWALGLARDELARLGSRIGSDVPLFFHRPVCVIRGRGEQIEEVTRPLCARVLLFLPELHCTTQAVYEAWDCSGAPLDHPQLPELLELLHSPADLAGRLFNDLEEPALAVCPQLAALARHLRERCPLPVRMTGSGSAFFCLTDTDERALADMGRSAVADSPVAVRVVPARIEDS